MPHRRHLAVAIAIALAAAACSRSEPEPPEGDVAAGLALPMLHGGTFDPGALAGKKVLVNFWRPGCGYCVEELPHLARAVAGRDDAALVAVMISGRQDQARAVARNIRFPAPILLDSGGKLRRLYEIDKVPLTFVLDGTGHAVKVFEGARDEAAFTSALDAVN